MKKWTIIYFIISNILTIYFTADAQTDSLFLVRQRIEFLRKIQTTQNQHDKVFLRISLSQNFREARKYTSALNELNKLQLFLLNDSMKAIILYEKALNYYQLGKYTYLQNALSKPVSNKLDSFKQQNIILLKIFAYNLTAHYSLSEHLALRYVAIYEKDLHKRDSLTNLVRNLYLSKPKIKSLKTAINIGTFVPGGGMIYAGKPIEGLWSASLQAAALGFAIVEFIQKDYITGYVIGLALLQKVYFGSLRRTKIILVEKNKKKKELFNKQLAGILVNI